MNDYEEFLNDDDDNSSAGPAYQMTIRIENIDTGSFITKPTTVMIAYIGSKKYFRLRSSTFQKSKCSGYMWDFKFRNPNKSAFVIQLCKRHKYFDEIEIGRAIVRLKDIPANQIITKEVILKPAKPQSVPPRIVFQLHRNEIFSPSLN